MLGSSVERQLGRKEKVFGEHFQFNWSSQEESLQQIVDAVGQFGQLVADERWSLYWCAGVGTMSASEDVLRREELVVERLLSALRSDLGSRAANGTLFFSSSAGGVYAGSQMPPMTELTEVAALSDYGAQKLRLEEKYKQFASVTGAKVVIGRIANLYGPFQNRLKGQGLVTSICQQALLRKPVQIFVGLDTLRNYIFVDDAAEVILRLARTAHLRPDASVVTKVICSSTNYSISSILKECDSVFGFAPQIVLIRKQNEGAYPPDLRMKSVLELEADSFERTPLIVGISRVWERLRREHQSDNLIGAKL
jgi:UDP-glucose 4-epimerase